MSRAQTWMRVSCATIWRTRFRTSPSTGLNATTENMLLLKSRAGETCHLSKHYSSQHSHCVHICVYLCTQGVCMHVCAAICMSAYIPFHGTSCTAPYPPIHTLVRCTLSTCHSHVAHRAIHLLYGCVRWVVCDYLLARVYVCIHTCVHAYMYMHAHHLPPIYLNSPRLRSSPRKISSGPDNTFRSYTCVCMHMPVCVMPCSFQICMHTSYTLPCMAHSTVLNFSRKHSTRDE